MSGPESESSLLACAVAGDRAALSQLFLLHFDALHRHVSARISPDVQALIRSEDVIQQTFVRAAQAIGSFVPRHDAALGGWLTTIADNLVRDAQKRRGRERRLAMTEPAENGGESGYRPAGLDQLAGMETSPSRRAQRGEAARHLQAALGALPDDQREVLRRRYLLEQSLDQIAEATGRTQDAVRGLCFRARKNLRDVLGRSSLYFSK
jgi:RNA polymerase sigma-70 factor (ECF subfamily)